MDKELKELLKKIYLVTGSINKAFHVIRNEHNKAIFYRAYEDECNRDSVFRDDINHIRRLCKKRSYVRKWMSDNKNSAVTKIRAKIKDDDLTKKRIITDFTGNIYDTLKTLGVSENKYKRFRQDQEFVIQINALKAKAPKINIKKRFNESAFLASLKKTGNVSDTCDEVGVSIYIYHRYRRAHRDFETKVREILDEARLDRAAKSYEYNPSRIDWTPPDQSMISWQRYQ